MERDRRLTRHELAVAKVEQRGTGGDTHPYICGYAAVFYRATDPGTQYNLWEGVVERIDANAFDVAMREDDVVGLFNHNPDNILGRNRSGTLKLTVDERGLYYEIDPPLNQLGKTVTDAINRGDLSGSSFAFEITGEEISREGDLVVRTVKQVRLYDVGPVTYPAYAATTTELTKRSRASIEQFQPQLDLLQIREKELEILLRQAN